MVLCLSRRFAISALVLVIAPGALAAQRTPDQRAARALFAELIAINSTHDHGSTTLAAKAVARRLLAAGFPAKDVVIAGPHPDRQNLVARLRGTGARPPILLLAHLDVVEARREDWSLDPFRLTEKDGYFYGRGTSDIKDMAAIYAQTLIALKRDRVPLDRDVILALTADEEGGDDNGVQWLLANRRPLIDAAYVINGDGGDPLARDGKVYARNVQASEKVYMDLRLEVHNPGGHSSLPVKDNAIYRLAAALTRVGRVRVPRSTQRGDARLLHPCRGGGARHDRRADADGGRERRHRRDAPAVGGVSVVQRGAPDDLRRDAAGGWPRVQRAAATCRGERQLPDAA